MAVTADEIAASLLMSDSLNRGLSFGDTESSRPARYSRMTIETGLSDEGLAAGAALAAACCGLDGLRGALFVAGG